MNQTIVERFEVFFCKRTKAIDRLEGFHNMHVLKPATEGSYLIVSFLGYRSAF
ncbi:MAG: hypothetical protein SGJ10_11020 [Bacteroidota bacterium]|nr:hypothetical protein [Bacteroidota bacterium]